MEIESPQVSSRQPTLIIIDEYEHPNCLDSSRQTAVVDVTGFSDPGLNICHPIVQNHLIPGYTPPQPGQESLPLTPQLTPFDNPVHISDVTDDPAPEVEVDRELELEIEHYMLHLAEEQDAILDAQIKAASRDSTAKPLPLAAQGKSQRLHQSPQSMKIKFGLGVSHFPPSLPCLLLRLILPRLALVH